MKDDTKPIKIPYPVGKKPLGLYITIAVLGFAVLILGIILIKWGPQSPSGDKDQAGQVSPSATASPSVALQNAHKKVMEIERLETDIHQKQQEILNILEPYKDKPDLKLSPKELNVLELTPQERKILQSRLNNETDVTVKSLLGEILEKDQVINQLRTKVATIEALLPKPHLVKKGETHFQIAWDYLTTDKRLPSARARNLVEKISLFDTLVPGFKVWNFYSGGEYGTFVTQGKAPITPNEAKRKVKKRLIAGRNKAVKKLEQLEQKVEQKEQKEKEVQKQLSTLRYCLDLKKNLRKRGVLKGGFLKSTRLVTVAPEDFDKEINLREESTITFTAGDFQLRKFKRIQVFPAFFKAGTDYGLVVTPDRKNATFTFLNKDVFQNKQFVISIE